MNQTSLYFGFGFTILIWIGNQCHYFFFSLQSNYKRVRPSCHFTFGKGSSNWNIGLATGSVCLTYHTIAICYSYGRYGRIYSSSGIFPTYNCYFAIVGQKQQHTNPMLWFTAEGLTFCMACGKEKFESVLLMLPKACWGGWVELE